VIKKMLFGQPLPRMTAQRRARLCIALAALILVPGRLASQQPDSVPKSLPAESLVADTGIKAARQQVLAEAHVVRWYEVAIGVGGVGALMALDEPLQRHAQSHRTDTKDDIASIFTQEGEAPYYAGISLGVLGVGLLSGNAEIRRAGMRMVASLAVSFTAAEGLKFVIGRARPDSGLGAFHFDPFSGSASFPSGHVTAAFAIATSLSDDIKKPLVSVLLYTAATGTAFARINDNRHWLSDTAMGMELGIFSAKLVNGHWRIFGIRPPGLLVTPTGAKIEWHSSFY
jgi:membrane-associated phospholipid phosphatase